MRAEELISLLKLKHTNDVFIQECKDGPTWLSNHLRMDAWVMLKSWAHAGFIAYETKVSRSDFLNDTKWPQYMNYCNEFYFCCPYGLIMPEELPVEVGLLWASKNGKKLMCKRKATFRNVIIPQAVFTYILMSRVKIEERDIYDLNKKEQRTLYWKNWLEKRDDILMVGHNVSKGLKDVIKLKIEDVVNENDRLKNKINNYEKAISILESAGINLERFNEWNFKNKVDNFNKLLSDEIIQSLECARNSINIILSKANKPHPK
ncbi:MAG: MmcB family DNA repair protein [Lutibacter sp.]|jgi:gas vesicle protein